VCKGKADAGGNEKGPLCSVLLSVFVIEELVTGTKILALNIAN
jgi:hypothetical protein